MCHLILDHRTCGRSVIVIVAITTSEELSDVNRYLIFCIAGSFTIRIITLYCGINLFLSIVNSRDWRDAHEGIPAVVYVIHSSFSADLRQFSRKI